MGKITVGIERMACGMCGAHINEAVRNAFQVKNGTSVCSGFYGHYGAGCGVRVKLFIEKEN